MAIALSLAVLSAFALVLGAWALWRRGGSRKQVVLMLVMAAVMAANVAIWAVPDRAGKSPLSEQAAPQPT
jgi:hypothetical protein